MSVSAALRSELFRAYRMHIGLVLLLLYTGVGLLYVFANVGAWVSVGVEDVFIGFAPDPSYLASVTSGGVDSGESVVSAALAHTVFFPVFAVVVVGMLCRAPGGRSFSAVSLAKGVRAYQFCSARAVVASLYLTLGYMLFSGIVAGVNCAFGHTFDVMLFITRTLLNVLLNMSYVAVCIASFTIVRNRALVAGGLIVVTFAGLIASMANPGSTAPMHMSYWIRTCGVGFFNMGCGTVVFSLASLTLSALVLFAVLRYRHDSC